MIGTASLMALILAVVMATALVLAPAAQRRLVLVLLALGILAAWAKVSVFQMTPQWRDINPDSITYDLNGRAFAAHWQGQRVDHASFQLRGLAHWHRAGLHGPYWEPDDALSYAFVVGSHEWLYAAYVGLFHWLGDARSDTVIASHVLWAAFFPAAAFGIALTLGANRRVALAAAGLALIDPNAGVNASWLLKDTLAGFLTMAVLWALLTLLVEERARRGPVMFVAVTGLAVLGGVRFVAYVGLMLAALFVALGLFYRKRAWPGLSFLGIVAVAWLCHGVIYTVPHVLKDQNAWTEPASAPPASAPLVTAVVQSVEGANSILRANSGEEAADSTTLAWKETLRQDWLYAAVRSVAHTLFAPYPWVAWHPGLNWRSSNELYYAGVMLWLLCLPGFFAVIFRQICTAGPGLWLVILFLASQLAAYTIWQGEWSTRQRVFVLPAVFALAAIGWHRLVAEWRRRRTRS